MSETIIQKKSPEFFRSLGQKSGGDEKNLPGYVLSEAITIGGGNSKIFLCSLLLGEMIQFDYSNIFQMGWNHQAANFQDPVMNQSGLHGMSRQGVWTLPSWHLFCAFIFEKNTLMDRPLWGVRVEVW